jgi:hypothetical protein
MDIRKEQRTDSMKKDNIKISLRILPLLCGGALCLCWTFSSRGTATATPTSDAAKGLPRFTGGNPPYADTKFHDGRFRPAVGVQNIEVLRGNRTHPELLYDMSKMVTYPDAGFGKDGFTYNHAPMLCYWKGMFWIECLSCPKDENHVLGQTLLTWSTDGRSWARPEVIFPSEKIRDKNDNKEKYTLCHQRMGFYVAPNGRLLVLSYYGFPNTPNNGKGVGRAVREIKSTGEYGPIYWIRYTAYQGYNKENSPAFPFYEDSSDGGFKKACNDLLADKLMVQAWYEEDQGNENNFYAYAPKNTRFAKAFCWYSLPNGKIVGLWKWRKMIVADKWEPGVVKDLTGPASGKIANDGENIYHGGAKIWGQRTSDGRYALVYNPVLDTSFRHPLSVITGPDGLDFDTYFLNVHGEVPPYRFVGDNKDGGGGQYVRGILPGNGTPPDGGLWLVYSSNKEDVWATHVPVPIKGTVDDDVHDNFANLTPGGVVTNWNIYSGVWTPITVVADGGNKVLRMQDKDPYDYAKAVRVFPETTKATISFRVRPEQKADDDLEIEVLNYKGQRPVRLQLAQGVIKVADGGTMKNIGSYTAGQRLQFVLSVDTEAAKYDVQLNGKPALKGATFAEVLSNQGNPYHSKFRTPTVERIEFRTGKYRLDDLSRYPTGKNDFLVNQPDLPGADDPVANAVFDLDDFQTATVKGGG